MSRIKIVTDSTAYLPQSSINNYDISIVPLVANYNGKIFPENQTSYYPWFFDRLRNSKEFPTTSQPAVGEFIKTYQNLTRDGSSVISLHISSKLSGTVQTAQTAASMLGDRDITVWDSHSTVGGLLFFVEEAARMASGGQSKENILKQLDFMKTHTHIFFLVDNLEYLYRGGRIGGAAKLLGTLLQIKPILYLKNGVIDVFSKVRTRDKAVLKMISEIEEINQRTDSPKLRIAVMHVDCPSGADYLKRLLAEKKPELRPESFFIGPVIGSHVGAEALGIVVTEIC
ncbi:MAG: DegV family protein [Bacillota bacterium]|jgi:DegV family protein with EDD domain